MKKKQQTLGFTLIEILAAVSLLALIVGSGFYFADIGGKREAVQQVALAQWVYSRMAQATLQVYATSGSKFDTAATDAKMKTALKDTKNVEDKAPNGEIWQAKSPTKNNEAVIVVPMDSEAQARAFLSSYGNQGNIEISVTGDDSDEIQAKYVY